MSGNTLFWCKDGKLENTLYFKFSWFPIMLWKPPPPRANLLKLKILKITAAKQKHRETDGEGRRPVVSLGMDD